MSHAKPTDPKPRLIRRRRRAEALRRKALSPIRILTMILALPLTTGLIAVGVYLRVSEYERPQAVVHLVALAGCDVVQRLVTGPFRKGEPGYHKRNDPDGDGVACGSLPTRRAADLPRAGDPHNQRTVGSAKFLKP